MNYDSFDSLPMDRSPENAATTKYSDWAGGDYGDEHEIDPMKVAHAVRSAVWLID